MLLSELFQDLDELRREPGRNPRIPVSNALAREIDRVQGSDFAGTEFINLFVHMSDIIKLGFNPRADYGETADSATPAGIYAYPAEYAHKITVGDQTLKDLPYGGDRDYAHVFAYRGDMDFPAAIDLQNLSWDQVKQLLDDIDESMSAEDAQYSPGKSFWLYTLKLANAASRRKPRRPGVRQIAPITLRWRELLKSMGIRAVIDRSGVIFPGEDLQAVFLYPTDLDQTALLHNRWDDSSREYNVKLGQQQKFNRESDWWEDEQEHQRKVIASGDVDAIDRWLDSSRHKSSKILQGFIRKIKDPKILTRIIGRRPTIIPLVDQVSPELVMGVLEELGQDPVSAGYLWRAIDRRWIKSPNLYSELTKLLLAQPRSGWQQMALEYLSKKFQGVDGEGYPGLPDRLRNQALAQLQGQ